MLILVILLVGIRIDKVLYLHIDIYPTIPTNILLIHIS